VHLGNVISTKIMPGGYMGNASAGFFLKLLADIMGLWIWGLCLWFFLVSAGAYWHAMRWKHPDHHARFDMTWYSFVFPNTAMATATQAVGKSFEARAIQILGTVMAVLLVLVWAFVFGTMLRAFWLRKLLWPVEGHNHLEMAPTVVEKMLVSQSSAVRYREQAQAQPV
jgi:tellurite resistance protein TehA-like permease